MPDDFSPPDKDQELDRMARQADCLAEYFRRGEIEHAYWLMRVLVTGLRNIRKRT